MTSNLKTLLSAALAIGGLSLGSLFVARPCGAQVMPPQSDTPLTVADKFTQMASSNSGSIDNYSFSDALPQSSSPAQSNSGGDDSDWHIVAAPYLWLPGVHGTVGAAGKRVSIHASPGDLLSNFKFGLMGVVELRRKRLVIPMDLMWVRLEDDHPIPLEAVTSAKLKGEEFFLAPKIGYRLVDEERLKITALTGFRYWHLGESIKFNPVALSFSDSQNWVDPLVGGRVELFPAPKVSVTVFGDVGGWGTGSQLEYQFGGLIGYKIKPRWTLHAGYRYLGVDYRSGGFLFNVITSGAVVGATINLK